MKISKKSILFAALAVNLVGCGSAGAVIGGAIVSAAGCAISGASPTAIGACAIAGGVAGYGIEWAVTKYQNRLAARKMEIETIVYNQNITIEQNNMLMAQGNQDINEIAALIAQIEEEKSNQEQMNQSMQQKVNALIGDISDTKKKIIYQINKIANYQQRYGYHEKLARQNAKLKDLVNQYAALENNLHNIIG